MPTEEIKEKAKKIAKWAHDKWEPFPEKEMFKGPGHLAEYLIEHPNVYSAFHLVRMPREAIRPLTPREEVEAVKPALLEKARKILKATLKMSDEYKVAKWAFGLPSPEIKETFSEVDPLEKHLMLLKREKKETYEILLDLFKKHRWRPAVAKELTDQVRDLILKELVKEAKPI